MKRTEGEIKREHGQAYVISLNTESDVFILARCGEDIHSPETFANADHIAVTWNASKGMTTKQAGLYLEHGAEMVKRLEGALSSLLWVRRRLEANSQLAKSDGIDADINQLRHAIALMEGK